jgi:hypothetical protein
MSVTSANLILQAKATITDNAGLYTPAIPNQAITLLNGTTAGTFDKVYSQYGTIVNNATPNVYDVSGSMIMADGNTFVIAKLVLLIIVSGSSTHEKDAGTFPASTAFQGCRKSSTSTLPNQQAV